MRAVAAVLACAALVVCATGVSAVDRNLLQLNPFQTGGTGGAEGGIFGGGGGGGGFTLPGGFPPFPDLNPPPPPSTTPTPGPTSFLGGLPSIPTNVPDNGATTPVPADGGSWDFEVSGTLKSTVGAVWTAVKSNPKTILETAFRHLAFQVNALGGNQMQVLLNSAKDMMFEATVKSETGRFFIFEVTGHSLQIFNVRNEFVDISGSEIAFQLTGGSGPATLTISMATQVSPASRLDLVAQVQFFLEGFLESMMEHFKMDFGAGDCAGRIDREVAGICNNPNPLFGSANTALRREGTTDPAFPDGNKAPSGPLDISARLISNICSTQGIDSPQHKLTDMFTFFGQFVDHDVGISPVGVFAEGVQPLFSVSTELFTDQLPIRVPANDPVFTGPNRKETLAFERTTHRRVGGKDVQPREILNSLTSFLDLGQVYGSEPLRRKALRSFSGGKLKVSSGNFMPFNGAGPGGIGIRIENAPNSQPRFYVGGDIRACENVNLAAMHVLFLREHNKVADEIASALPGLDDETLFRYARDVVTAEYQSIIYAEWLPLMLGSDSPRSQDFQYKPSLNPSVGAFFTTASFRFGHTMVNSKVWKVAAGASAPFEEIPLRELFFEPEKITDANIDDYIRGMSKQQARAADMQIVDELRNFLFTEGGPSMDLCSLNIQRGRDVGLPSYNGARAAFNLPRVTSFAGITTNVQDQGRLDLAYKGDVDLVDPFIGGLAEDALPGKLFGPLFHRSLVDQFVRLRDGDRLFYKNFPFPQTLVSNYERIDLIKTDGVKMADIIARNSRVSKVDVLAGGRSSAFELN